MQQVYVLNNINEVAKVAWDAIGDRRVIAFHGEMGAGKTTLVHALCAALGVADIVGSPTFALVNEYVIPGKNPPGKIFHIDLYRLRSEQEAVQAGIEDCLYSDHICLVEWPEKAPGLFPDDTCHIYLEVVDADRRKLRVE